MKDTKKIYERALANVPNGINTNGVSSLQDLLTKVANVINGCTATTQQINYFKKYGVYEAEFVANVFPNLYAMIQDDVEKRQAKENAKKGKKHHHTIAKMAKIESIEDTIKKYREEAKAKGEPARIGYARVSTKEQSLARQTDALTKYGCGFIFEENVSGKDTNRPQFVHMMSLLEEGDEIVISDLTRLARSTADLTRLIGEFQERGISLVSLKESWIDTKTAQGRLMFTILAGLAEFERELLLERQAEGIKVAQQNGVKFGKPLNPKADIERAIDMYINESDKYTVKQISEICNVSKTTLWRRLRDMGALRK